MSDLILSRSSSSSSGSGGIWTEGVGCSGICGLIISGALVAGSVVSGTIVSVDTTSCFGLMFSGGDFLLVLLHHYLIVKAFDHILFVLRNPFLYVMSML